MTEFTPTFEEAFQRTIGLEGPQSNDPNDHGGNTHFGITKEFLSGYLHRPATDADIDGLTLDTARAAYFQLIWQRYSLENLDGYTGMFLFDWFTTSGGAPKAVQKLVGAMPDGVYGPKTLNAINQSIVATGWIKRLCKCRADYYINIVASDPPQIEFLHGWLNRVFYWVMPIG